MYKKKSEKENIKNLSFSEALGERYIAYAMSTIVSRSQSSNIMNFFVLHLIN